MGSRSSFSDKQLQAFEQIYDATHEDIAAQTRGQFLESFPLINLPGIEIDDYVIGRKRPTFCTHVEAKTRPWANIQGATANKFGIYFGKTKTDPEQTYRFTRKFGNTKEEAFSSVKDALLSLASMAQSSDLDFDAIDANPLSQMFKAKILSLYFPDIFLNVCSAEHLELLGTELGYAEGLPSSQYQYLLVEEKNANRITRDWSNPKFMMFLYDAFIRADHKPSSAVQRPRKKAVHRKVNFEDIQTQRDSVGRAAEEFALAWEKQRLEGAGMAQLISKIDDRRDRPGFGYDFLSHTSLKQQRYIEVKSVGRLPSGEGHRFFLSDNERVVSMSTRHRENYFFYLVFFDKDGQPEELRPICADELYQRSEVSPASYVVRFCFGRPSA